MFLCFIKGWMGGMENHTMSKDFLTWNMYLREARAMKEGKRRQDELCTKLCSKKRY